MKVRNLLVLITLLIVGSEVYAQNNKAVIWRGFEHSWTYNHRINRVGDYVQRDQDSLLLYHMSASGAGADSTYFTSHYTLVESPNVAFHAGVANIKLYGKEKQLISKDIEISIPAPEGFEEQDLYATVLNGFDLQALGHADKIQLLRLAVDDAQYAKESNELRFNLRVAIVVNCQSFECSRFDQKTTYDLKVHYLIMAGSNESMVSTSQVVTKSYPWGKKHEHNHLPEKHTIYGKRGGFQQTAMGVRSMAITLDVAHWTVEYHNNVTLLEYDKETGRVRFATDLFFKEWHQGMQKMSAKPEHSRFSSRKEGWCVLDVGVVLLQFKDAKIKHGKHKSSMYWTGLNASPNHPNAVSTYRKILEKD
ncbi:MAG: hypothetical protein MK212_08440 [Saprospiraceae bacterium]|nr:hypothetical protein [Saprospiraceae bacterium]